MIVEHAYDGQVPPPWDDTPDPAASRLLGRVRTGDWLDAQVFPPMRWAVPGLIPEGMGLFTGPPKAGKSWCALDIALAVAGGTHALGKVATGPARPVLLLALEDGERRLKGRCRHLLADHAAIPANFHFVTSATPSEVPILIGEWLAIHGQHQPLVLLDTLGKVMPNSAPGESAYQRDYRVGTALKRLTDEHPGSTLLVVHHVRKATSEDWMDGTSGTNGLNGAADFTLNLSRNRNEDNGILRVTGRDVPEGEYAITSESGRWTLDGTALADAARKAHEAQAMAGLGDRSAEIVEFVNGHQEPVTPRTVEDKLGIKDARRYLTRLAEAERIQRVSRGLYARVPSVPCVPSEPAEPPNGTHGTDGTHTCTACELPLHDSITADGFTTHPTCERSKP